MQAEADGKSYNPYDKQLPEDDFGCMGTEVFQVDQQMMQRYLIENAAVVQAREQQGISSDSRAGLEALVNDLYDLNDVSAAHMQQQMPGVVHLRPDLISRVSIVLSTISA